VTLKLKNESLNQEPRYTPAVQPKSCGAGSCMDFLQFLGANGKWQRYFP
jgi:hypothetical protein